MVAHDVADTAYLIDQATQLSKDQWTEEISPGQVILDWDGPEPSVGAVLGAIVWTKEVWLATIEGRDFPSREATQPASTTAQQLAAHHDDLGNRWAAMVSEYAGDGSARRHRHRRLVRPAGVVSAVRHRRARADLLGSSARTRTRDAGPPRGSHRAW